MSDDSNGTGRLRILVVDDEADVRLTIVQVLRHLGHASVAEADPLEALGRFESDPMAFDVVSLDNMMPGMTGLQLAKKLREIRTDIPIVLVTGYSSELTEEEIEEAGIGAVIQKPFHIAEFASTVARLSAKQE